MGEGLRKVSKMLAARPQLFGVRTEMIGITKRLFKDETPLPHVARSREAFDIPERAHGKRSLASTKSIRRAFGRPVEEYQGIFDERVFYGGQSGAPARVTGADKLRVKP